jgi:hypothetical protein
MSMMSEAENVQWDSRQEEENRQYLAAKCPEPHTDGSKCRPSWDGFVFICLDNLGK